MFPLPVERQTPKQLDLRADSSTSCYQEWEIENPGRLGLTCRINIALLELRNSFPWFSRWPVCCSNGYSAFHCSNKCLKRLTNEEEIFHFNLQFCNFQAIIGPCCFRVYKTVHDGGEGAADQSCLWPGCRAERVRDWSPTSPLKHTLSSPVTGRFLIGFSLLKLPLPPSGNPGWRPSLSCLDFCETFRWQL